MTEGIAQIGGDRGEGKDKRRTAQLVLGKKEWESDEGPLELSHSTNNSGGSDIRGSAGRRIGSD